MKRNNHSRLTDKNLDRLSEFLNRELEQSILAPQIPNGAHLFYGSYNDSALTQANIQLVSKILIGMSLGYVEDAPLVMMFEYKPGKQTVIDLSDKMEKARARMFIEGFQKQSQHEMVVKINELVPA